MAGDGPSPDDVVRPDEPDAPDPAATTDNDFDLTAVPDELLRPAIELAFVVAVAGTRARPPIPAPSGLRPYLKLSKLPSAALGRVRAVVEDDITFRAFVAPAASEDVVGRAGVLWLQRPDGWLRELVALAAEAAGAEQATALDRDGRKIARRLEAAEAAARKAQAELATARAEAEASRAELEAERERRRALDEVVGRLERRVVHLEAESANARRRHEKATERAGAADAARLAAEAHAAGLADTLAVLRGERDDLAQQVARVGEGTTGAPPGPEPVDRVDLARTLSAAAAATAALTRALDRAAGLVAPVSPAPSPAPDLIDRGDDDRVGPDGDADGAGLDDDRRCSPFAGSAFPGGPGFPSGPGFPGGPGFGHHGGPGGGGGGNGRGGARTGEPSGRRLRRVPITLPGGVLDDSRPAAEHLVRFPGAELVVDGYNVSKRAWPELPLPEQRRRLVDALHELSLRSGNPAVVVFDGAGEGGPTAGQRDVLVLFTRQGVIADDEIVRLVAELPVAQPVVVATSDMDVRRRAKSLGANVISSQQLLDVLRRA